MAFMNKKVRIAFLVSIIVNVLLLGIVLGALPHRFERRVPFQERLKADAEKLQEPARTRFLEGMEKARQEVEPIREQMRQARERTLSILASESFDEAAYDQQVEKIHKLRLDLAKRMSDSIKQVAKDLEPEQRKELTKILHRPPRN
jgi:uncharacterized membrane protein